MSKRTRVTFKDKCGNVTFFKPIRDGWVKNLRFRAFIKGAGAGVLVGIIGINTYLVGLAPELAKVIAGTNVMLGVLACYLCIESGKIEWQIQQLKRL